MTPAYSDHARHLRAVLEKAVDLSVLNFESTVLIATCQCSVKQAQHLQPARETSVPSSYSTLGISTSPHEQSSRQGPTQRSFRSLSAFVAPESQLVLTAVVSVVVVYVAVATTVATAAAQSEVTFVVRARGTGSVPSVAVVASAVVAATVAVAEVFAESVASWHRPAAAARQFDELAMSSPRSASVSATPVAGQLTVAGRS